MGENVCRNQQRIPDEKRLKKIASLSYGRTLDIGCNDNPNIFLKNPIGFDLENTNKGKAYNYQDILIGDCQELSKYFSKHCFDTIIAGEVIEHLENPAEFLRECKEILKDDGLLLITTPNPYNLTTIIANAFFIDKGVAGGHINLFPYRNMITLLSHCGLKCEKVLNAIGGTKLIPNNRFFFVPMVKSFCWQLLYIVRKN